MGAWVHRSTLARPWRAHRGSRTRGGEEGVRGGEGDLSEDRRGISHDPITTEGTAHGTHGKEFGLSVCSVCAVGHFNGLIQSSSKSKHFSTPGSMMDLMSLAS